MYCIRKTDISGLNYVEDGTSILPICKVYTLELQPAVSSFHGGSSGADPSHIFYYGFCLSVRGTCPSAVGRLIIYTVGPNLGC